MSSMVASLLLSTSNNSLFSKKENWSCKDCKDTVQRKSPIKTPRQMTTRSSLNRVDQTVDKEITTTYETNETITSTSVLPSGSSIRITKRKKPFFKNNGKK